MTLAEWIAKYEAKAEKLIPLRDFLLHYEPEKGFFYWHQFGDVFEIDHTCTDDHKWVEATCMQMARERGCKLLRTATFHDPAAYMRLFKATPNIALSGIRPNGKFYWIFEKQVKGVDE